MILIQSISITKFLNHLPPGPGLSLAPWSHDTGTVSVEYITDRGQIPALVTH